MVDSYRVVRSERAGDQWSVSETPSNVPLDQARAIARQWSQFAWDRISNGDLKVEIKPRAAVFRAALPFEPTPED